MTGFETFVSRYNWLGQKENKTRFGVTENLARNLPGAMMQDYLLNLAMVLTEPYPSLETFTEVRVAFGTYPIWRAGEIELVRPSERSDIAVGYRVRDGAVQKTAPVGKREPVYSLPPEESVAPIITINSKIRVSQSEFFDWHGREQLMTKGNPNCLSVQVVLRKEMDLSIVEAAQAGDKWFLLGAGGERNVVPDRSELNRLVHVISEHLADKMTKRLPE
jgi:hypothetical protein